MHFVFSGGNYRELKSYIYVTLEGLDIIKCPHRMGWDGARPFLFETFVVDIIKSPHPSRPRLPGDYIKNNIFASYHDILLYDTNMLEESDI